MGFEDNVYTIREINALAAKQNLSKIYKSYTTLYNLVRSGRIPCVKLGNRYLLRICDIEKALTAGCSVSGVSGIRRID